jgi:diguanylate cyclase (GGDEF)-like protein/PAS domain S-box-containing protein
LSPTAEALAGTDETDEFAPLSLPDALARMTEAENTLRAIGAGEVDAFVMSDGERGRRVFSLATADRPYRMFVENMRDGAATLSASGIILYANRRLAELLSYSIESIVGSPLQRFLAGSGSVTMAALRGQDGLGAALELTIASGNGESIPVLVGTSPLEGDSEHLTCLTFTDLSEQKAQEREIARLATHDGLTGLPNRTLLVDRIDQALTQAKRSSTCTAVFFIDLDRFKQVNDTQGHARGDVVLRQVAEQLVSTVRPMDTVARIGGDEFAVLSPQVDSHLHAVDIGTRIVEALCRRIGPSAGGHSVAASVGIAVSLGGRGTAETLLNEADTAMYKAKSLGGGRSEVFEAALGRQVQERSAALQVLQSALDDRRVIAHYQPVVDLSTGEPCGFEALARIAERDGSLLSPSAFIAAAEDSGLVVPLGMQVLELACEQAHHWPRGAHDGQLTVAVNLSPRQFAPGNLTRMVRNGLEHTGLDPTCLHLELTETAIIDLNPDVLQQLASLRDLGVEIGLDDFGTGYASLTHLRRLPLTFVKIDQTFVQGLGTDKEDERIVAAVVDLAANLGLRSIGEGVETEGQRDRLQEMGCDNAQGYLFAKPLPPGDVPTWLGHAEA